MSKCWQISEIMNMQTLDSWDNLGTHDSFVRWCIKRIFISLRRQAQNTRGALPSHQWLRRFSFCHCTQQTFLRRSEDQWWQRGGWVRSKDPLDDYEQSCTGLPREVCLGFLQFYEALWFLPDLQPREILWKHNRAAYIDENSDVIISKCSIHWVDVAQNWEDNIEIVAIIHSDWEFFNANGIILKDSQIHAGVLQVMTAIIIFGHLIFLGCLFQ